MSSNTGDIPLPPGPEAATLSTPGYMNLYQATGVPAYDPQTLAYYQAYYSQYQYGSTGIPGVAGVVPSTTGAGVIQSGVGALNTYDVTVNPYHHSNVQNSSAASYAHNIFRPQQSMGPVNNKRQEDTNRNKSDDGTDDDPTVDRNYGRAAGTLPIFGNEKTMNLNPLLLTNIQQSPYFRTTLYSLKNVNELLDEIWNSVKHMEPWERGSRKVGGQTGMCASVRGVGSGGIVSTPFCILYKLFTLRPNRKQVNSLMKNKDSPFIRAIGFLYVRYTQPPDTLWSWFQKYLDDPEEYAPSSGGGPKMSMGTMARNLLTKLDWFSTLFPRIPVPIQKDIEKKLEEHDANRNVNYDVEDHEDDYEREDRRPKDNNNSFRGGDKSKSRDDPKDDRRHNQHEWHHQERRSHSKPREDRHSSSKRRRDSRSRSRDKKTYDRRSRSHERQDRSYRKRDEDHDNRRHHHSSRRHNRS